MLAWPRGGCSGGASEAEEVGGAGKEGGAVSGAKARLEAEWIGAEREKGEAGGGGGG